jgi:hypothetical protein
MVPGAIRKSELLPGATGGLSAGAATGGLQ